MGQLSHLQEWKSYVHFSLLAEMYLRINQGNDVKRREGSIFIFRNGLHFRHASLFLGGKCEKQKENVSYFIE